MGLNEHWKENNMQKKCSKCKQIKEVSEFNRNKKEKDGLQSWCKVCSKQAQKKYRKTEKGKESYTKYQREWRNSKKGKELSRKQLKKKPYRHWARSTLADHRKKGNEIKITFDELETLAKQSTYCKICGCELMWGYGNKNGKVQSNSPTLDRIDNGNTISVDSIQILCHSCNTTKRHRTMDQMLQYCKNFVKKFEEVLCC
jgi:hypothetical protein